MSESYPIDEISTREKIPFPNYTQIPNVIADNWCAILSDKSFKILFILCRKIFGWHKTTDSISKNQLMKITGMSKNTIQSAIDELEKYGLVIVHKHQNEFGHQPNTYSLNIHEPIDELYSDPHQNLPPGRSSFDPGVGQVLTQGVGQNLTPQKKDLTKERLTKEREREATASPPPSFSLNSSNEQIAASQPKKKKRKPGERLHVDREDDQRHGEFVRLTIPEYEELCAKYSKSYVDHTIRTMNSWLQENKPEGYLNYKDKIENWIDDAILTGKFKPPFQSQASSVPNNPNFISEEIIEKRRVQSKKFITRHWDDFRSNSTLLDDKVDHIRIGNDKIYYKDTHFETLIKSSLKKFSWFANKTELKSTENKGI